MTTCYCELLLVAAHCNKLLILTYSFLFHLSLSLSLSLIGLWWWVGLIELWWLGFWVSILLWVVAIVVGRVAVVELVVHVVGYGLNLVWWS